MAPTLQALLACLPIVLGSVLLVARRWPASRATPVMLAATALVAAFAWRVPPVRIAAAALQGLVITADILLIVFGALLLLHTLERSGGVAAIRRSFHGISDDRRVQLVLVAWLFGSFIEGAAGFGTPAAIAAPLLVALGFPAACAVMLGMMIQSTAVTFGAAGTPVLVGLRGGLGGVAFEAELARHGWSLADYLQLVTVRAGLLHGITGTLMPTLMVMMMTRFFGARRSWSEGLSILPFTLFAGLAFTIPYTLAAVFLGPEFPSLLGSLLGLCIVTIAARRRWLLPAERWDFVAAGAWPAPWNGTLARPGEPVDRGLSTRRAWLPYALVALLLLATRLPQLPLGDWLRAVRLDWRAILGTGIDASTTPLYLPASVMVAVAVATSFLHRMRAAELAYAVRDSGRVLLGAGFVLVFTVPMVRIYIHSDGNDSGLPSMPLALAQWVADHVGTVWPAFAGVIGALGAFIAGSNTVSNLMFATFQHGVADSLGLASTLIVALQAVGAAAGNMIAIHNVVAASATVGLLGQEGVTLRRTILPTLYYLATIGGLGLLAAHLVNP